MYADFVKRVVGLPPAHSLSIVVEQLIATCRRMTSSFISGLLFCIYFPLLPFQCLPVVKQEGLRSGANDANGPASRGCCGARCTAQSPCFAPALQPLLEEVKMSHIQLSWKADAGLEFPLANHNYFSSFYRKFILKIKDTICFF